MTKAPSLSLKTSSRSYGPAIFFIHPKLIHSTICTKNPKVTSTIMYSASAGSSLFDLASPVLLLLFLFLLSIRMPSQLFISILGAQDLLLKPTLSHAQHPSVLLTTLRRSEAPTTPTRSTRQRQKRKEKILL